MNLHTQRNEGIPCINNSDINKHTKNDIKELAFSLRIDAMDNNYVRQPTVNELENVS